MNRTAILGAGFSRAISGQMPLTDELGKEVLGRVASGGFSAGTRPYRGIGFEAWLSRLAEPQPDLSHAENAENRALFLRVAAAVRDVVVDCQLVELTSPMPWWLRRLIGAWHHSGTNAVITFNYDLLVEHAIDAARLWGVSNKGPARVSADAALRFGPQPPYQPPQGLTVGATLADTFQLLKLHGSIDWFWLGDRTAGSVNRWRDEAGWGRPLVITDVARRQALPDRVPLLIPPAASKSSFYANPLLRELWQQAAQAVGEADEVAMVGYSLPVTDLVTVGMLSDRLRDRSSTVLVFNPKPAPVRKALRAIDVRASRVRSFDGPGNVCEVYANYLERQFSPTWVWPDIDLDTPLGAGPTSNPAFDLVRILHVDADATVVLQAVPRAGGSAPPVTARDLIGAASVEKPRARIQWPDGSESYVARTEMGRGPSGAIETLTAIPVAIPDDFSTE